MSSAQAIEDAARKFCDRHKIDRNGFPSAVSAIGCATTYDKFTTDERQAEAKRLRKLWAEALKSVK